MKVYTTLFYLLVAFLGYGQSNSVLSKGNWYKFSIDTTGVFKIDNNFLNQLGINSNSIDPKNIKIFGNGGTMLPEIVNSPRINDLKENAIYVHGQDDGVFNNDDYILFYGKGPHDWEVSPITEETNHRQNIYSDKSYYFLIIDDTPGKRIQNLNQPNQTSIRTITSFDDFIFYERETKNLFEVGRLWFGEDFSSENFQTFSIPFPNQLANSNIKIKVSTVANSSLSSQMSISSSGTNLTTLNFPPSSSSGVTSLAILRTSEVSIPSSSSNTIQIELDYNNGGLPSAEAYLDFIEISGKKNLIVQTNQFNFRSFEAFNTNGIVQFDIQGNNIDKVWDVSDHTTPKNIENNGNSGIFSFKTNGNILDEFIAIPSNSFYTPSIEETYPIENQDLHSLENIQYLVITNDDLYNEARRLTDYHENNSNLSSVAVKLNQIYNEFSSGSPDVTAIRDFIKQLYDNSSSARKLRYVCFLGDSSYDYKDRLANNNNVVPTFHATQSFDYVSSYVTDDYFVMIDPSDGSMLTSNDIDIASGRIPVTSPQEAKQVIDKILNYYSSKSFGDWRNSITLLADDIDQDADRTLQAGLEEVADSIKRNKPFYNINKLYADAFRQETTSGGERYPQVKNAISNTIEKGTLVFDYFGHGGEDGLADERLLEIPQIEALNNFNTLPLFITVTCEFSRFDNPSRDTAGEKLFLNKNGGAVSMITTTRNVFISLGERFNKELTRDVLDFNNRDLTISENLIETKNRTSSSQKYFIYYFGDPAMKLAIPKPNIKLTKINDKDITQSIDTLKALSRVSIEGIVTDDSDNILSNFNGSLSTTIYDKSVDKQTLDNDGFGVINTFDSQESKLFRGKSSVNNGVFKFEFIVPKDIKIAFGKGKISLYANNKSIDKGGANFDVTIGGINPDAPEDNIGPELQAFLNDESFVDGGTTNASPNLLINLADPSGINTSITAVDHDIVAILDNNESDPIVLNDYYQTELDDFTKGNVSYKLRDLSEGLHTLRIKAWDTYNNSSEITLSFVVVSDSELNISNVLNYPNPFVNYTEFWFNHNKPNEPLEVRVQIFTVSGKLVKTINQISQTTGNLSRSITWNGLDDFGNKIGKGVYVYKLNVRSTVSNGTFEKYEKLVIL
ncbi:type IX secretion system sortase PorU [Tenacibaculum sp. MAR_2009_124]|uniref:type IX secretion system sortase PorU n=1 Tax=Tenacibaculum sp. MAR_2009_124 TaxID=1250059 RepID=UPI000B80C92F|nr:type IX secretion system sortase PorU [Tenacibaculum sp. MAR_2009_124]